MSFFFPASSLAQLCFSQLMLRALGQNQKRTKADHGDSGGFGNNREVVEERRVPGVVQATGEETGLAMFPYGAIGFYCPLAVYKAVDVAADKPQFDVVPDLGIEI